MLVVWERPPAIFSSERVFDFYHRESIYQIMPSSSGSTANYKAPESIHSDPSIPKVEC